MKNLVPHRHKRQCSAHLVLGPMRRCISAVFSPRRCPPLTHDLVPSAKTSPRGRRCVPLYTSATLPENVKFMKTYAKPEPMCSSAWDKVSNFILVLGDFSKPLSSIPCIYSVNQILNDYHSLPYKLHCAFFPVSFWLMLAKQTASLKVSCGLFNSSPKNLC